MVDVNPAELAALVADQISGMPDDPIEQFQHLRARSDLLAATQAQLAIQKGAVLAALNADKADPQSFAKLAQKIGGITASGVQSLIKDHKDRVEKARTVSVDVEMETAHGGEWELVAGHLLPLNGKPREAAEFAIRVTLGLLPETREPSKADPCRAVRAVVRQNGHVLDEIEVGDFLCDADTERPLRRATWWEQAISLEAENGVFEDDGRRVFVG